ncbi:MAG: S9 family peptidase [Deltaproteobacteria bacterium]|nr:S9 family peptidase [Deltaproteobacteria bacterium]MBL7110854.1 S9 family peptidase [Bacteroidales bacterium]
MKTFIFLCVCLLGLSLVATSQQVDTSNQDEVNELKSDLKDLSFDLDQLRKAVDDIYWYNRVGDVAFIDKVYITGPPVNPETIKNKTAMGINNPVKFYAYVFVPRGIDAGKQYPLLVFPHGGVHGDFTTYYAHIIRELMAQQYIVIAPEYRGSTGYGKSYWERIDYGGLEVEDTDASRNYMVENYDIVDNNRIGILGWSHGGMISLLAVFNHPDHYSVCFAGVPVSDLISRMGYQDEEYRALYSADYHLGKTAQENVEEYKKRSPAWNTHKLKTPLLIHTNTNDDDVNVLEVEHLIKGLKADGKKFEYEIFQDVEGGHSFDRIDTRTAKEIRLKIYAFLNRYLKPPHPLKTMSELEKAAYEKW